MTDPRKVRERAFSPHTPREAAARGLFFVPARQWVAWGASSQKETPAEGRGSESCSGVLPCFHPEKLYLLTGKY